MNQPRPVYVRLGFLIALLALLVLILQPPLTLQAQQSPSASVPPVPIVAPLTDETEFLPPADVTVVPVAFTMAQPPFVEPQVIDEAPLEPVDPPVVEPPIAELPSPTTEPPTLEPPPPTTQPTIGIATLPAVEPTQGTLPPTTVQPPTAVVPSPTTEPPTLEPPPPTTQPTIGIATLPVVEPPGIATLPAIEPPIAELPSPTPDLPSSELLPAAITTTPTLYPYQPLTVCWVQHVNGQGSTQWQITNPNPVPLSSSPDIRVRYNWYVYDGFNAQGDGRQSATGWDNPGQVLVNTAYAQSMRVEWYLVTNGVPSGILGSAIANANEGGRCGGPLAPTNTYTPTPSNTPTVTFTPTNTPTNTDTAPMVISTTPSEGATNIGSGDPITINFSEPISISLSSIRLECPVGTSRTFTLTPLTASSYRLTPTAPMPSNTACRMTIQATGVSDSDRNDPPNNMVSDFVLNFTTADTPTETYTLTPSYTPTPTRTFTLTPTGTPTLYPYQPLTVCWVQHVNGQGSTQWTITNPNPVSLSSSPEIKVRYNWYVYDGFNAQGNGVQSSTGWDNPGQVLVNTAYAQSMRLEWYLVTNGVQTGILGSAVANANEGGRCGGPLAPTSTQTPTNTSTFTLTPTSTPTLPPYQPLTVCWVGHGVGMLTTQWIITNPNPVPLSSSPDIRVLYNWNVYDDFNAQGNRLQADIGLENPGQNTVNSTYTLSMRVEWYLMTNRVATSILGSAIANADDGGRCGGSQPPTNTYTPTPSNTHTLTATFPPTNTYTLTPSDTPTPTETYTLTPSDTPSSTNTFTPIPSDTPTPTETDTSTPSLTYTLTPSDTPTPTETFTLTPSDTPTATSTYTLTPSDTFTPSPTYTLTPSDTPTSTETNTPLPSDTATYTPLPSDTPTDTPTLTPTSTLTPSNTSTSTDTNTPTPSDTYTPTASETPSPTDTFTPSATATFTASLTYTFTPSDTSTATSTYTATETASSTHTNTPTPSETPIFTQTSSPTPTSTDTFTPTTTNTATSTETSTPIPSSTSTSTPTETFTPIPTNTPLPTNTFTAFPTNTPVSPSSTPEPMTPTVVPTPTLTPTRPEWQPIVVGSPSCEFWGVFNTDRTGSWNVFRVGALPEGVSGDKNLTRSAGENVISAAPSISPDRRWITFTSNRTGNFEVYVSSVVSDDIRQVTFDSRGDDAGPVWSPNGRYIAFNSNRTGNWDLYIFDVVTGVTSQLTNDVPVEASPMWSPDSSTLYYESDETGRWQIYSIFIATREVQRISSGPGDSLNPVISGDGNTIAFRSNREGENALYLMNERGDNLRRISEFAPNIDNQTFSPDDSLLAYDSNETGRSQVYLYELATGITRRVTGEEGPTGTFNPVSSLQPTWSCVGNDYVAFSSERNGNFDLYIAYALPMNARPIIVSEEAIALTNSRAFDVFPQGKTSEYDTVGRSINFR